MYWRNRWWMLSTYTQDLRLNIVPLSPKQTRSRHGLVLLVPVRHAHPAGHGRGIDDGHGVGGQELAAAVVGVAEGGGKLRGFEEPEDPDEDRARGFVAADFEHVSGPEGGSGQIVPGDGDGVVDAVVFFFDWVHALVLGRQRRAGTYWRAL